MCQVALKGHASVAIKVARWVVPGGEGKVLHGVIPSVKHLVAVIYKAIANEVTEKALHSQW